MGYKMSSMILAAAAYLTGQVQAVDDVFHMPAGQKSLEMVPVGDPGNAGELSGSGGCRNGLPLAGGC